ncbi:MAG: hypothetical protein C4558_05190 [Dehalococcoidia bacterium]|nr:MAG: hypothetical protein C4558_05190 [Dehalococcoidia bacterium]
MWKPRPGATASGDEFIAARALFASLHEEALWNPWVLDDRASEIEQAKAVMEQWTRAEPRLKQMTRKELKQLLAREREEFAAQQTEANSRREIRRALYDPQRDQARLALLEQEAWLTMQQCDRQQLLDGTGFPAMQADRRAIAVKECDTAIARIRPLVDRTRAEIGDPETVIDQQGWLPAERRERSLSRFSWERREAIRQLRVEVVALEGAFPDIRGRKERADARRALAEQQARLDEWVAIPALTSEQMCSECQRPAAWHLTGLLTAIGWQAPCLAWPYWSDRIRQAREMLLDRARRSDPIEAPRARPQPLAKVPSGIPISEVVSMLTELQAQHPDAEVRRAKDNGWELWSSD